MEVNCSERKKPPASRIARMTICGVDGWNKATAAMNVQAMTALTSSTRRKPKRRRIGAAAVFMVMAPTAPANVSMPDWNGVMPKPS